MKVCYQSDKARHRWCLWLTSSMLNEMGHSLRYYPNTKKRWLLTKQGKDYAARELFRDTAINIFTQGQKNLGAVLGSRTYLKKYVNEKVEGHVVVKLAEFATTYPQASYAALTFGLKDRWTYYLRGLPDIEDLLEPLERAIRHAKLQLR